MSGRFAVVALARPRSAWYREVARWSSAATLAVELDVCLQAEEAAVRLRSGRPASALLVDGAHPQADRDLFDLATRAGAAVVVVDDGERRPWAELGAHAVLTVPFTADQLAAALAAHAVPVDVVAGSALADVRGDEVDPGTIVAVTGAGGSGTSTVARATAQGLAAHADAADVVLADLALHADQALAHDVGDVLPGLQELVEACRTGVPGTDAVRGLTWTADHLPYALLLGLRRHRDWTVLRERSTSWALGALATAFDVVVADIDPDVEGEDETGSLDVADRNLLARTVLPRAALVLVTARPDTRGLHRLARHLHDLHRAGVEAPRLLPVLVGVPRRPALRSQLTAAVAEVAPADDAGRAAPPLLLGARGDVERAVRDGRALPAPLARSCGAAAHALLGRVPPVGAAEPMPVAPGSLGAWLPEAAGGHGSVEAGG